MTVSEAPLAMSAHTPTVGSLMRAELWRIRSRRFAKVVVLALLALIALVILLASIYAKRPLDFAAFPTLLLIATLLRLALNIASTRVVLLHGHGGTAAAPIARSVAGYSV